MSQDSLYTLPDPPPPRTYGTTTREGFGLKDGSVPSTAVHLTSCRQESGRSSIPTGVLGPLHSPPEGLKDLKKGLTVFLSPFVLTSRTGGR